MSKLHTVAASLAILACLALPGFAQTTGKASQLITTPANNPKASQIFTVDDSQTLRELNAEERRYQRPARRFELRRVYSPLQRVPRGNHEYALLGDQPDTVIITDLIEW